jgi:CHAD domain-containing protein
MSIAGAHMQHHLHSALSDELQQLDALSVTARQRMRELAQELAAEFSQQLQQEMAQQLGGYSLDNEDLDVAPSFTNISQDTLSNDWLANALSGAFNQTITRIAQGKSLSSRTAIAAIFQQPARQLGTQWGKQLVDAPFTQLRLSDAQSMSDLWSGLTLGLDN